MFVEQVAAMEERAKSLGPHGRARPGRLSDLSVFLCKSVFYGAFVWARWALNRQKRRSPARAVPKLHYMFPAGNHNLDTPEAQAKAKAAGLPIERLMPDVHVGPSGAVRVTSDCHVSEGTSKNRTQIPIIHRFYLFSALPSLV
jgi:hypothetical protein